MGSLSFDGGWKGSDDTFSFYSFKYISTDINLFCYREAEEDSDDNSDEDGGSAEENKEEVVKETPKQSEETEFQRRQKELIQK